MNTTHTKVERKYHRSDKWYKRFRDASVFVLFFTLVGSMVYGYVIAQRLQDIAQRIEDSQKGTACIILILPQNRNSENVTDCIEKNKTNKDNEFEFKDNKGEPVNTSTNRTVTIQEAPNKVLPITINEEPLELPLEPSEDPEPTEPVVDLPRVIEHSTDELGIPICRVVGDLIWVVGDCE